MRQPFILEEVDIISGSFPKTWSFNCVKPRLYGTLGLTDLEAFDRE
jgi:hypothetical protein